MENEIQRVKFVKPVYTCPFCDKEVLGYHTYVANVSGDVPYLELIGLSTLSHSCGKGPTLR